jgi:hypothetical protein
MWRIQAANATEELKTSNAVEYFKHFLGLLLS